MSGNGNSGSHNAWGDRIRALRNVPPVLRILWESGPSVVTWGLALRLVVAAMPWAIGWGASRIIEGVKQSVDHQPLPPHFAWIVGAEVVLALLFSALSRAIDYTEQALAIHRAAGDRYGEARVLRYIGSARAQEGRLAEAREMWTHARSLFATLGENEPSAEIAVQLRELDAELGDS